MAAVDSFQIYELPVNNVTWEPYVVSNNCNEIIFLNAGTDVINLRTDDSRASSQLGMGPGQQYEVDGHLPGDPARRSASGRKPYRFLAGDTACYFQSTTALNTGPVKAIEVL